MRPPCPDFERTLRFSVADAEAKRHPSAEVGSRIAATSFTPESFVALSSQSTDETLGA